MDGLIQMEEAKSIGNNFISRTRKPDRVEINSVEPKGDRWEVTGSTFTTTERGGGSETWIIEIKGKDVLSFKFNPGTAFVFG